MGDHVRRGPPTTPSCPECGSSALVIYAADPFLADGQTKDPWACLACQITFSARKLHIETVCDRHGRI